jgi:hypothetical protein
MVLAGSIALVLERAKSPESVLRLSGIRNGLVTHHAKDDKLPEGKIDSYE